MRWLKDISIASKILLSLGLMAAFSVAVTAKGIDALRTQNARTQSIVASDARGLFLAMTMDEAMGRTHQLILSFYAAEEQDEIKRLGAEAETSMTDLSNMVTANKAFFTENNAAEYTVIETKLGAYLDLVGRVRDALRTYQSHEAYLLLKQASVVFAQTEGALKAVVDGRRRILDEKAAESQRDYDAGLRTMALLSVVGLVLAVGAALLLVRFQITRPLALLSAAMQALEAGRLDLAIDGEGRRDEIGRMTQSVRTFREHAVAIRRLEEEKAEAASHAEADKRRTMDALAERFGADVGGMVQRVAGEVERMNGAALELAQAAGMASQRADAAGTAAGHASRNVQAVATAADQLSASIREIGRRVTQSSDVSGRAAGLARDTNARVAELRDAAGKVGAVVDLIQTIARQTNLLALNATIEASRAGEAGKGFAVVASEVKGLASQTARATEDISGRIAGIQAETVKAAGSIQMIADVVEEVNAIAAAIAAAVEQQAAATAEIARNVQEAAGGTEEVSRNIERVTEAAVGVGDATTEVGQATAVLSSETESLKVRVSSFLAELRG